MVEINGTILDPAINNALNGTVNNTVTATKELLSSPGKDFLNKGYAFLQAITALIRAITAWVSTFIGYAPSHYAIPGVTLTVYVDIALVALAAGIGFKIMKWQLGQGFNLSKWLFNSAVIYAIVIFI